MRCSICARAGRRLRHTTLRVNATSCLLHCSSDPRIDAFRFAAAIQYSHNLNSLRGNEVVDCEKEPLGKRSMETAVFLVDSRSGFQFLMSDRRHLRKYCSKPSACCEKKNAPSGRSSRASSLSSTFIQLFLDIFEGCISRERWFVSGILNAVIKNVTMPSRSLVLGWMSGQITQMMSRAVSFSSGVSWASMFSSVMRNTSSPINNHGLGLSCSAK